MADIYRQIVTRLHLIIRDIIRLQNSGIVVEQKNRDNGRLRLVTILVHAVCQYSDHTRFRMHHVSVVRHINNITSGNQQIRKQVDQRSPNIIHHRRIFPRIRILDILPVYALHLGNHTRLSVTQKYQKRIDDIGRNHHLNIYRLGRSRLDGLGKTFYRIYCIR